MTRLLTLQLAYSFKGLNPMTQVHRFRLIIMVHPSKVHQYKPFNTFTFDDHQLKIRRVVSVDAIEDREKVYITLDVETNL